MGQGKSNLAAFLNCFVVLIFASNLAAQYRFENWTTAQGLPYKTVNSVLQTRDGYIWAATGDGLARFDGVRFSVFNTANSAGLKTNRLKYLAETVDGSLWIGGYGGATKYKDGKFTQFTKENGFTGEEVYAITQTAAGDLWFGTAKGVRFCAAENLRISPSPTVCRTMK